MMDKRKSILNVSVSITFKIITMLMVIAVKRVLICCCGNEVNGLNALYLSIVGFLSVAELGIGSAITFCMYKPIVDGDHNKVSALYHLFRRLYWIIGGVILLSGLAVTPFIHVFAKDYAALDVNLYLTFVLMLLSVVLTYLFASKTALINAYKNNYITSAIQSVGLVLQYVLQIAVVYVTHSFVWYLVCRIAAVMVQWALTELAAGKRYRLILSNKQRVDRETQREVTASIKAMFMHQIGNVLVNSVDSMVISFFVGVIVLGEYSNYITILSAMNGVIVLVFTSLTSVVGHLYAETEADTSRRWCERFHFLNFVIGTVFFLGYYAIIDNLIAILFFEYLVVEKSVSFVITLNGFVQFMRHSVLVFRNASGTFYYDRWKPLFEGVTNLVLSVLLVKQMGVTGVIAATILTNLLICHIVEPYVLYRHAFSCSPKAYYKRNYGMILLFTLALFLMHAVLRQADSQWAELLVNGVISVGISGAVCIIAAVLLKEGKDRGCH